MHEQNKSVVILTGVTDEQYCSTRSDDPFICTSAGKRILLYRAIASAAGKPLLLLSPHPRGHGKPSSLPEMESRFDRFAQRFSRASKIRKVRFFLNMLHYAAHVYRNTKSGDILIIDNYELIYVLALYYCRLRGRRNPIILEYEDGKHLTDKGVYLWMSRLAEMLAKPLVDAAILATHGLTERLPKWIPFEIVPGILNDEIIYNSLPKKSEPVHVIYSGSLDSARGAALLLDYLKSDQIQSNAIFHITGQGAYAEEFNKVAANNTDKIIFHGCVSREELSAIQKKCHFGLNLQTTSNPISQVTYPSKTFDYLNAGIRVISTTAAGVREILGDSAYYLSKETPEALSCVIREATTSSRKHITSENFDFLQPFTTQGTIARLNVFFDKLLRLTIL
jgi:glycosyltransferase involved in cell wall biosynthesis